MKIIDDSKYYVVPKSYVKFYQQVKGNTVLGDDESPEADLILYKDAEGNISQCVTWEDQGSVREFGRRRLTLITIVIGDYFQY